MSEHNPLDWRRCRRYVAQDVAWIRKCIEWGDYDLALSAVRAMRSYLHADIIGLIPSPSTRTPTR